MKEEFLHFIWKNCLFENDKLFTSDNQKVEVISPGELNTNAGPDFIAARIKIGDTTWAGNVEIHQKASQWNHHHHQKDKKYNNVILHIVNHIDEITYNERKEKVPTAILIYPDLYYRNYLELQKSIHWISCLHILKEHKPEKLFLNQWIVNLAIERLQQKTEYFKTLIDFTNNNWEDAFYIFMARYFGGNVNTTAFEMLAKITPQKILAKHKNNLVHIEALLFGQAGFLADYNNDPYFQILKKEYSFLRKKYALQPMDSSLWNFFRLRPSNFPTMRIAEFSSLIYGSVSLFSKIIHAESIDEVIQILNTPVSEYWQIHIKFGEKSAKRRSKLGKQAINTLLINTVIPVMFYYGKVYSKHEIHQKAMDWFEQLPAENNSIIRKWKEVNICANNALETQGLIQLKKLYCDKKKCLNCRLGKKLISTNETRKF